jgi:mRNA interferase RelE/StbE
MMRIAYSREALKTLRRIPANTARTIRAKIEQYAAKPSSLANNVKRLRGRPGYRLRVGEWRVIFDKDGDVVSVLLIGPRGGIYED